MTVQGPVKETTTKRNVTQGGGGVGLWVGGLVWFWTIWPNVPTPPRGGGGLRVWVGGWVQLVDSDSDSDRLSCLSHLGSDVRLYTALETRLALTADGPVVYTLGS